MSGGRHCYPNSDVLVNKYNIRDKELLEKLEIQKVAIKLLGLDVNPDKILSSSDAEHLANIHKYLFGDIYEWAGTFRKENFYKCERVLSGGSAEYADYKDIECKLEKIFQKYKNFEWENVSDLGESISDFLLELWSVHPFREGNTRTCITFLWHYLRSHEIDFHVELLCKNPMYVRDSLVMANYGQKEYLIKIISDASVYSGEKDFHVQSESGMKEEYRIAKADYEAFKQKYAVKKELE